MEINGYEVWDEPTDEEFATYRRVKRFLQQEWIAGWLEGKERLEQGEFIALCEDFEDLDFSAEETDALYFEYDRIIEERS